REGCYSEERSIGRAKYNLSVADAMMKGQVTGKQMWVHLSDHSSLMRNTAMSAMTMPATSGSSGMVRYRARESATVTIGAPALMSGLTIIAFPCRNAWSMNRGTIEFSS